jgi:hypothetical protein
MADLDTLTRRVVDSFLTFAARTSRLGVRLVLLAALVSIPSYLLGLAVFDGGMRTVWAVLGGVFLAIGVGGPLLALLRLIRYRGRREQLTTELRQYLGADAGAQRTVIETFETGTADDEAGTSVVVWSRSSSTPFGTALGTGLHDSDEHPTLRGAVSAATSLPLRMILSVGITAVFAFLGVIFLIAAAL